MIPQCAIYNPPGNSIPDNAFVSFYSHIHFADPIAMIVHERSKLGDVSDTTSNFINGPFYP